MTTRRRPRPIPAPAAPPVLPIATAWARERITAAGPAPSYGSPAWHALPDEDPRRLAAALIAAEAHHYEAATAADRLRAELAEMRHTVACAELEDAIVDGARRAQRREARTTEHTARSINRTVQAMTTAPFAEPTPVRDSAGWPWVRQPGADVRGEQLRLFAGC